MSTSSNIKTKVAFVINARNKEKFVKEAILSAFSQTYPCEIILSYQDSSDNTYAVMKETADNYADGLHHTVKLIRCPIEGPYGMQACNDHFRWAYQQSSPDCNLIVQLSADDRSLPERVACCVEAFEANPCDIVATTMYYFDPLNPGYHQVSGFPQVTGYVNAAEGLLKLAYGSTIHAYSREFLDWVGDPGPNTIDVLWGFLAALRKGFYVVAVPQHIHVMHASENNMGMQGRLRGAVDAEVSAQLNELNRMQLTRLYKTCLEKAGQLLPDQFNDAANVAVLQHIIGQALGWVDARELLRMLDITPRLDA